MTPPILTGSSLESPKSQCQLSSDAKWRASLFGPERVPNGGVDPPFARAVDEAQYESREGPCLDAVDASMVYAESFPDVRWPNLGMRPTESGVESVLSYRLSRTKSGALDAGAGSLNSYGVAPYAFDDSAQEIGLILAAHASMAARAVEEQNNLERLGSDLQQALLSRDVIGQAKGILMERLKVTPEVAFDVLREASQRLNVKLWELARQVAETGELRATGSRPLNR